MMMMMTISVHSVPDLTNDNVLRFFSCN